MVRMVFIVLATIVAVEARAEAPKQISWNDLAPDDTVPDPFKKLSPKQLTDLSFVVRIQNLIAAKKVKRGDAEAREAESVRQELMNDGVDIDWLVGQRRRVRQMRELQSTAVTKDLIGKRVKLSGYVLPLRVSNGLVSEFLLVADFAACSHAIAPAANQLVYVKTPKAVKLHGRATAVSVSGQLDAHKSTQFLLSANGPVKFEGVYAITPDDVKIRSASE